MNALSTRCLSRRHLIAQSSSSSPNTPTFCLLQSRSRSWAAIPAYAHHDHIIRYAAGHLLRNKHTRQSSSTAPLSAAPSATSPLDASFPPDFAPPATASHTPNPIPATFIRGGTSKGIFINRAHLPQNPEEWGPIFRGIMGSPDPFGRQLNGMGGGISSLSKIVVVGKPTEQAQSATSRDADGIADVEYTFIQVGIKDGVIDTSGNCGNLTTAVGVYALEEEICKLASPLRSTGRATIKLWNTNTRKTIRTEFPVDEATGLAVLEKAETTMAGVPGKASKITLEFLDPAGAKTGKLLPTGQPRDIVRLVHPETGKAQMVKISCVDATNPTVFITLSKLNALLGCRSLPLLPSDPDLFLKSECRSEVLEILEEIRQQAALLMGLDPNTQAQPKITVFQPAENPDSLYDMAAKTLSMGVLHKAIPSTVALCYAAAVGTKGSVVNQAFRCVVSRNGKKERSGEPSCEREEKNGCGEKITLELGVPGGVVEVKGRFGKDGRVRGVEMVRTARRLMKGGVYW